MPITVKSRRVRYSGSIMNAHPPLDPIRFTRELCEIESTTYHEGAVGDFLADFLAATRLGRWKRRPSRSPTRAPPPALAGMSMPAWPARRPIWSFPPTWTPFRPTSPSAKTPNSCTAAAFPTPRASSPPRSPLPKPFARQGFGLGCCLSAAKSATRPAPRLPTNHPKGSRFLINGEPTDNRLALASKGALRAVFKSTGKMAHSAYPELGDSAVHKLVEVLARLLALPLPVLEDVGPSTLNIGQIHGGHAPNVIADKAEAQVLVRLVSDSAPVRAALIEAAAGLAEVDFTLEIPFVRLRAVEGLPTMIAKFTTDIPQLTQLGRAAAARPGLHPRGPHAL